ncbi:MAG: glycerate kinase [Campylobacteraceae bacterium]|nr:glycerate kinase [Campylobacteraceae bacterium]
MKVVIAIDSFKGCMSSQELSISIEEGIKIVYPDALIEACEVADGGEGTLQALVNNTNGDIITCKVHDPLMGEIQAQYGILGDGKTAVIEMARSSGLPLVPIEKRNPLVTTTFGVGELISDAIAKGCREFIVGIGGSATNDAGVGMLQALGYRFLDKSGVEVGLGGGELGKIHSIDTSHALEELQSCHFLIACDVDNPMYGMRGASQIYGRQKGATEEMVLLLDENVKHFATIIEKYLGKDIAHINGTGAAGALGGGFLAFLNAQLRSGIEIVLDTIHFEEKIKNADFVITGEGKIDAQSLMGKVISGISKLTQKHKVPLIALAGHVEDDAKDAHQYGVDAIFSIMNYPMSLCDAMQKENTQKLMKQSVEEIFRLIKISKTKQPCNVV